MASLDIGMVKVVPTRGFDDGSDDESESSESSYDFNVDVDVCDIELLLVTSSKLSNDFVEVYVRQSGGDDSLIGCLSENLLVRQEDSITTQKSNKIASLRKLGGNCCHLTFTQLPNSASVNDVVGIVFSKFNCKSLRTVVLTDFRVAQFHHQSFGELDPPEDCISRCLKSSKYRGTLPCKRLEQPNIVGGISAAILTEREFCEQPCILLVSYTDTEATDSITLGGYRRSFFALDDVKRFVKRVTEAESDRKLKAIHKAKTDTIFM